MSPKWVNIIQVTNRNTHKKIMKYLFVLTTYAQKVLFYSVVLKEFEKFHFFFHGKNGYKLYKSNRVGSFDAGFQQVPLVQNF